MKHQAKILNITKILLTTLVTLFLINSTTWAIKIPEKFNQERFNNYTTKHAELLTRLPQIQKETTPAEKILIETTKNFLENTSPEEIKNLGNNPFNPAIILRTQKTTPLITKLKEIFKDEKSTLPESTVKNSLIIIIQTLIALYSVYETPGDDELRIFELLNKEIKKLANLKFPALEEEVPKIEIFLNNVIEIAKLHPFTSIQEQREYRLKLEANKLLQEEKEREEQLKREQERLKQEKEEREKREKEEQERNKPTPGSLEEKIEQFKTSLTELKKKLTLLAQEQVKVKNLLTGGIAQPTPIVYQPIPPVVHRSLKEIIEARRKELIGDDE